MKLSANSRIIRWAFMGHMRPPAQATLCRIFWLSVLFVPLQWALIVVFAPLWVPVWAFDKYCAEDFKKWRDARFDRKYRAQVEKNRLVWEKLKNPTEPSGWRVLWLGLKAVKSKVCPIVVIVPAQSVDEATDPSKR